MDTARADIECLGGGDPPMGSGEAVLGGPNSVAKLDIQINHSTICDLFQASVGK